MARFESGGGLRSLSFQLCRADRSQGPCGGKVAPLASLPELALGCWTHESFLERKKHYLPPFPLLSIIIIMTHKTEKTFYHRITTLWTSWNPVFIYFCSSFLIILLPMFWICHDLYLPLSNVKCKILYFPYFKLLNSVRPSQLHNNLSFFYSSH